MVRWWLVPINGGFGFLGGCKRGGYRYEQKCSLVNVKLKWVKDGVLDGVVAGERSVKAASIIVSLIASNPHGCLPIYHISSCRGQLGLPNGLKVSSFMRRYPSVYDEYYVPDGGGTRVPWFRLTPEALDLYQEELSVIRLNEKDFVDRLCKLLMLTKDRVLPLQTIDQLKWDLGLPYGYVRSLIPCYSQLFSFVRLPDDRAGLKLLLWDECLAVSELVKNASSQQTEEDITAGRLAFPIGFTRGFGLKRKCISWLEEWQRLPYTCPYSDASHLDPRTDVSEKRIVGVFHELLHLTVQKKTERRNVSNLRKPLALPQKFTKVFERHPGIFYISKKNDTQTVVLREAYNRDQLIQTSSKRRKFSSSEWENSVIPYNQSRMYEAAPSSKNTYLPPATTSDANAYTSSSCKRDRSKFEDEEVVFMSRDEIERCSPSRKDGIDAAHETHLRYSYCAFLQNLGVTLELPQTTIGSAMVLCHRFFVRRSHASHDRFLIATAALFLATKSEETPCPLNNVLRVSCEIFHKQDFNVLCYMHPLNWFEQYRERVIEAEQLILTTLNFELNVQHPYAPLTNILEKLGLAQSFLVHLALSLVSEGLRSSLWLQFKPHQIAAGAAYLAARSLNMDLSLCQNVWQEFHTPPSVLKDVVQQLMELF